MFYDQLIKTAKMDLFRLGVREGVLLAQDELRKKFDWPEEEIEEEKKEVKEKTKWEKFKDYLKN
mgnify:CR=1 FL=1